MYVNLHNLPAGQAMFTLYVGPPDTPEGDYEEHDQVAPARAPEGTYLTSLVIDTAKDMLLEMYGDTVQVYGIVDQSEGYVVFDSRDRGFRPIPVIPPRRLAEYDRPYDTFIDLCVDAHDGIGTSEYLDYLTATEG